MKLGSFRGLTAQQEPGAGGGGIGATCMVYSDDTPALIKALAWASKVVYGARVQICNGVADEVEINAAMGAIAALGGRVLLSEGTFHIADPIVVPANGITLMGFDSGTIIDGDLLATGEHGIVVSGMTDVTLRDFAIQTEDGGGKVCHCIFVEDGANGTHIDGVHILDSDSDGIHVEGTTMFAVHIHDCTIDDTDGAGIYMGVDAGETFFRFHISDCLIMSSGTNGIEFADGGLGYYHFIVDGNIVYLATLDGVNAYDLFDSEITNNGILVCASDGIYYNSGLQIEIRSNVVAGNVGEGIWLIFADDSMVSDNICWNNGAEGDHAGIKISPDCTQILVEGNCCDANSYYGIRNDGPNNEIIANYVHESARHGILIQGGSCICSENYVHDNGQETAGTYDGIYVTNNGYDTLLVGNYCDSPGDSQEDGIHIAGTNSRCSLVGNWCSNGMGSGIYLMGCYDHQVHGNFCYNNDDYGIELEATVGVHVKDNMLVSNDTAEFLDGGTDTATPEIWAPIVDEETRAGFRPVTVLTDNVDDYAFVTLQIPLDFQQLLTANWVVIPAGSGNMVWSVDTSFGKICANQQQDAHTDGIGPTTTAVTDDELECLPFIGALTDVDLGDNVGVRLFRDGDNVDDTVNANVNAVGVRLRYV